MNGSSRSWDVQRELWVGLRDYVVGGSCSPPFLSFDGAPKRRPMVMGSMDLSDTERDAYDTAIMWSESGADGICIRLSSEGDAPMVAMICAVTGLPLILEGDPVAVSAAASAVQDSVLMLVGAESDGHVTVHCASSCDDASGSGKDMVMFGYSVLGELKRYRSKGLKGDECCKSPAIADIRGSTEDPLEEAMHGLEAMLCGADMIVMSSSMAADMCRFQGEELADL
jgi:hypothetical protein